MVLRKQRSKCCFCDESSIHQTYLRFNFLSVPLLTVTTIPAVKSSSVSLIIRVGAILVFCSFGNNAFDGCLLVCLHNNLMVMITRK